MRKTKFTLLAMMLFISVLAFGQEKKNDWIPKVSGFAQVRYDMNFDKDFDMKSNTFFIQRACLNFDGKITDKLSYRVSGDFIRRPALTDAYLKYAVCDAFVIQAGQMKTPLTIENQFNPAFGCEMFDYATVIKQLTGYENGITGIGALGRDIGVMASGSFIKHENNKGESFYLIDYNAGIFNGNGINNKDNNNRKDFIGRIDFHPFLKDLVVTASYQNGEYFRDSTMQGVNNRMSFGFQYKSERLVIRNEFIFGETGRKAIDGTGAIVDKPFNSKGLYAVAGYWFYLGKNKSQKIMPAIRFESLEKDDNIQKGVVNYYTAGVNYMPVKQVNFKINYQLIQPETGDESHAVVAILNFRF